jgi:glycosyltransferase involved in cell wall biosynthesis
MSSGRPIITSDAAGCRETVKIMANGRPPAATRLAELDSLQLAKLKFGENGILVPTKDSTARATAMEFFVNNPECIPEMGVKGRRLAEERFDVNKVNEVIMCRMGL